MGKWKKLEENIDQEDSTYTDWQYLENVLEWLEDYECLTTAGKDFRNYIWKKYVKGR